MKTCILCYVSFQQMVLKKMCWECMGDETSMKMMMEGNNRGLSLSLSSNIYMATKGKKKKKINWVVIPKFYLRPMLTWYLRMARQCSSWIWLSLWVFSMYVLVGLPTAIPGRDDTKFHKVFNFSNSLEDNIEY